MCACESITKGDSISETRQSTVVAATNLQVHARIAQAAPLNLASYS